MKKLAVAVLGILMLASCTSTQKGPVFGQARIGISENPVGRRAPAIQYIDAEGKANEVSFHQNGYTLVIFSSEDKPAELVQPLTRKYPNIHFVVVRTAKDDCLRAKKHGITEKNLTVICDPESMLTKLYTAQEGQGFLVDKWGEITQKRSSEGHEALASEASRQLMEKARQQERDDQRG
jgi:hypothetical protein